MQHTVQKLLELFPDMEFVSLLVSSLCKNNDFLALKTFTERARMFIDILNLVLRGNVALLRSITSSSNNMTPYYRLYNSAKECFFLLRLFYCLNRKQRSHTDSE